jgi:hypothetical protein
MKYSLSLYILFILCSCNNHRSQSDEIFAKIDSLNQSLNKINDRLGQSTSALYDSVEKKYSESYLQQFRYHVSDFKAYMDDLKRRFTIACGDPTGEMLPEGSVDSLELSNKFFIESGPGKDLPAHFEAIKKILLPHTSSSELKERINQLGGAPFNKKEEGFMKTYFNNVPPVAALTILSKFANDVNNIENKILQEYLSK